MDRNSNDIFFFLLLNLIRNSETYNPNFGPLLEICTTIARIYREVKVFVAYQVPSKTCVRIRVLKKSMMVVEFENTRVVVEEKSYFWTFTEKEDK